VAEIARLDAGKSRADLGAGVPAKGTDSPEAAVRDLITAATKLDVRRLVELLPPDELGAVHDYAALFLGAAERGAQDANKDVSITMPTLELDSSTSGDHATVRIRKLAIAARLGDASFAYRDGCIDVTPPATTNDTGRPQHVCDLRDTTELLRSFGVTGGSKPPTLSFANKKADIGIIATRVDGKWYVSPTRTSLVALVDTLRMFRPSDLTTIRDDVKQVLQGFTGSAGDPTSPDGSVGGVLRSGPATTAGA
jgi:hypothetical protein